MQKELPKSVTINERKDADYTRLVSIITPALNSIKYLKECIQSVLNQSYPSIEHIFVDGGSTDGTLEMLASYQSKYRDKIRFISEPDKGACDAWNKGLRIAGGEILGWLGADDTYEPDAITMVVEFFRTNPDAYFVFGECNYINETGRIIGKYPTKDFDLDEAINDACHISCPSAFYRREVIERIGFMDTSINMCDHDYWIRVGKVFRIYRIEKVLSNFRKQKGSVSGAKGAGRMYALEGFVINRRYRGRILSPRVVRYLVYRSRITAWTVPILTPIWHLTKKVLGK